LSGTPYYEERVIYGLNERRHFKHRKRFLLADY